MSNPQATRYTSGHLEERVADLESRLDKLEAKKPRKRAGSPVTDEEQAAADRVVAALNKRANRSYRATGESLRLIVARLRDVHTEGGDVDDLLKVVWHRCRKWVGSSMAEYLRPSTLFQKRKFDEYMDEARDSYDKATKGQR